MARPMKDIKGFVGLYAVTEDGFVWSHPRTMKNKHGGESQIQGRWLKQAVTRKGYMRVALSKDCKGYPKSVHRLVAEAFIPNPDNKPEVNHIDGNKQNNHVSNLEWVTGKENMRHAIDTGLKDNTGSQKKATEATTKDWVFTSPSGELVAFHNLQEFCRQHDLQPACMGKVASGERKQHKGWTRGV